MSHLVIGANSFISRHLQNHPQAAAWKFVSFQDALNYDVWSNSYQAVLNLAINPAVLAGSYSDFDLQIGQRAQNQGAHYIAMSSRSVYGYAEDGTHHIFDEQYAWLPDYSTYGYGKRLIEKSLQEHLDLSKLTILRPSNIFGFEYDAQNPRSTFFGHMLRSLKEKGVIFFDMDPTTKRDFINISDFINILVQIITPPTHNVYNVGSGNAIPCGDIANWVMEGYGSGSLDVIKNAPVKDSFELNVSRLKEHYKVTLPRYEDIQNQCLEIGRKLRDL